jgi:hypothetical protein
MEEPGTGGEGGFVSWGGFVYFLLVALVWLDLFCLVLMMMLLPGMLKRGSFFLDRVDHSKDQPNAHRDHAISFL